MAVPPFDGQRDAGPVLLPRHLRVQVAIKPPEQGDRPMDFTLVGLWHEMGFTARAVVVVLVIMSLYSLAIAGERRATFLRGRKQSRGYIEALAPLVEGPGRLREAV